MQAMRTNCLFICMLLIWPWTDQAFADGPVDLLERLEQTNAVNIDAIIEAQFRNAEAGGGFSVVDPYGKQAAETLRNWQPDTSGGNRVCALRFTGADQTGYELRDFESPGFAAAAGFIVTHQGRCGSCSTLQDLAVYLADPDLTTPARQCARRFGLARKKQCFEEKIGFTAYCAESWAYNARNTKNACMGTCIADYGLFNLLFRRYGDSNLTEAGQLRPCLQCDEQQSGPGFKYSAGRTRRNSGIESAIPRPESEFYPVDHSAYFE